MPISFRVFRKYLSTLSDMPEGALLSEFAQLRIVTLEETRSQHQANIPTILRLLPGCGCTCGFLTATLDGTVSDCWLRAHLVPNRKFICSLIRQRVNHGNLEPCHVLLIPDSSLCSSATMSVGQLQLFAFDAPHSACHALLQSHHVETLRALAPSICTHGHTACHVPCHHLLYASAKISPLLNPFVHIVAAASAAWLPGGFIVVNLPVNLLALHCGSYSLDRDLVQNTSLRADCSHYLHHEVPCYSEAAN